MNYVDVVFDGPPGPESGRFVECEGPGGVSVNAGAWTKRDDGLWRLRIRIVPGPIALRGRTVVLFATCCMAVGWIVAQATS